jgi:hypothetical protein
MSLTFENPVEDAKYAAKWVYNNKGKIVFFTLAFIAVVWVST